MVVLRMIASHRTQPGAGENATFPQSDYCFAAIWIGISVLAAVLTLAAHFSPLSPTLAIFFLALPTLSLLFSAQRNALGAQLSEITSGRAFDLRTVAFALLIILPVTYLGSRQIIYFDTAYYHLQMALSLQEFGTVRGLANLFTNFGQSSTWFALAAPGTAGGEWSWGSSLANVFISLVAGVQGAFALGRLAGGSSRLCDYIPGIGFPLVLFFAARWGMIASTSPDLVVMLLSVTVAWCLCLPRDIRGAYFALPVAAFAVTVKLSAIPLFAIAGIAVIVSWRRDSGKALIASATAIAILLPFLSLSVLASGCLAVPIAWTCFDLPWTPSAARLASQADLIISAARGGGVASPDNLSEIKRFIAWASRDTSGAIILISSFVLGAVLLVRSLFMKSKDYAASSGYIWVFALAALGLLFVATTAPTGRFAGGYAAVLDALFVASFPKLSTAFRILTTRWFIPVGISIGILALHVSAPGHSVRILVAEEVKNGRFPDPGAGYLLPKRIIPFDIHHPTNRRLRKWKTHKSGPVTAQHPITTGECWAAPPPCLPQGVRSNMRYLDADRGIQGGFYREE